METKYELHVPAGNWTTVYNWLGMMPLTVKMKTNSSKRVNWRCLGLVPGYGKFRNKSKTWVIWPGGTLQVKSKEAMTLTYTLKPEKVKAPAVEF